MKTKKIQRNKKHLTLKIILSLLVTIGFILLMAAKWYTDIYGNTGFDSILFSLFSGVNGVQSDLIMNYLKNSFIPAIMVSAFICFIIWFVPKSNIVMTINEKRRIRLYPFSNVFASIACIVLTALTLISASNMTGLPQYVVALTQQTTIFEDEYIDPDNINIVFPEKKRNLIYIYLESMENTFMSVENGGAEPYELIPELYEIAKENTNFSQHSGVGGARPIFGGTWTIGAMTSQTSGLPLKLANNIDKNNFGENVTILPNVTTLNTILNKNGYHQALMVGSNAEYGGRKRYFLSHGVDDVFDIYTAREDGIIPDDYWVWWGMEDEHLFEYAKLKITNMAKESERTGEPFAFTMLTVDTHHVAGYKCDLCDDEYEEQYENVIRCSSIQVGSFIEWIQSQPFYENTTIVMTGDHCTMDNGYIQRNITPNHPDYDRRVYNCFINSAIKTNKSKNREFLAFDMFPTTLAALGCEIDGERLGLGTNLFSDVDTLAERLGVNKVDEELSKLSRYFNQHFLNTGY